MLTIEKIKKIVAEIAPEYNLKRVTLFGSRANGNFNDDSDIDLIVDFPEKAGLIAHVSLKYALEDAFGLNVDVISRGGLEGSILRIEKEIEIYAA
ncbi:MAG: nucleotidyltransferase domain-containing protein [Selenomonadaceae bacterium]|nr:nucleotidyltransferase domain-containing protein [Selenomonadaceae bacterium]